MANAFDSYYGSWTTADVVARFGDIPFVRVRQQPLPGTATEADVVEVLNREGRLCELVDGTLVEKAVGTRESYLAVLMSHYLLTFILEKNLGVAYGADNLERLAPGLVRIPDVSFYSWARLPKQREPQSAFLEAAPDLAIEVISKSNSPDEMARKLQDYFAAGVRLVWYVYPAAREVHVYTAPQGPVVLGEQQTLDGGAVLPGFQLELAKYFAEPEPNPQS